MSGMTDLERVVAIEEIKVLMARRCRSLDARDWPTYQACHAPDHISRDTVAPGDVHSASLVDALKAFFAGITSIHRVHSAEIEFSSPTEATGIWAMEDRLYWKEGDQEHWMHGWGHYYDTYSKREGRWLFTSRRLERERREKSQGATRL